MSRLSRSTVGWAALIAATLILLALRGQAGWLVDFPKTWTLPLTPWLNDLMKEVVEQIGWLFRAISDVLAVPLKGIQHLLLWLPWSVIIVVIAVAAHAASGWGLVAFSLVALGYMVVVGYWDKSMNSLSLVAVSVPLAIIIGFGFGVWGFMSKRSERWIMPMLDLLQTVPAFAYIIPIVLLFGFGPIVGLIASILFAFPPMVRNTILGLKQVPAEVIESGLMSGATPVQLFWQVRIPTALKQLLLGMNQTTMAAFSMIIIASIIGGTDDIGWEVTKYLRKASFGECLLAGIVIALLAMVMDRITAGLATRDVDTLAVDQSFYERHTHLVVGAAAALAAFIASLLFPALADWPEDWAFYPASAMNAWLSGFIVDWAAVIAKLKALSFFYLMLPVKIGLERTISPFSWGFELTAVHSIGYAVIAAALVAYAFSRKGAAAAVATAFFAIVLYFGLTGLPWAAFIAMATYLAWQLGGRNLAIGTFAGFAFLLLAGVWPQSMLSIYLCGIAVAISFLIGTAIGIAASEVDWVSAIMRPINDTLQTMPQFVILIPFVMIFKIGDFTALLAIIAYAIVPAIRYAEHGLRSLPKDVIEAATCMGCTRWQLLWQVKLPLALPVIMLGLNQTIMYGLAMLVIAALVGTSGLGQQVYIGLGDGDFGVGIIAGLGMAIIAMIADRMTQAWSRARQEAFGLA